MRNKYLENKKLLSENNAYDKSLEHEACGVGLVATTNGKVVATTKNEKKRSHGLLKESTMDYQKYDTSERGQLVTTNSTIMTTTTIYSLPI